MPILSPADHQFFAENGYVLVPGVVPKENCDAVIDAIWEFLEMDRDNLEDWFRPPLKPNGMVEMYQHQSMWDNRQHPRMHQAFSEILGTDRLWVSFDRVNLKPPPHPAHPEYEFHGFIHWDTDTTRPRQGRRVQGVLYLADTAEDQGGFQCVPELYRNFDEWVRTQPPDRHPKQPDLGDLPVVVVPGNAGDLLIWDTYLAHGNGHNRSGKPRFAQYISMYPAREQDQEAREYRIRCWQDRLPPRGDPFPGDSRQWEQQHGKTAHLTPLGRKLLGLDSWDEV